MDTAKLELMVPLVVRGSCRKLAGEGVNPLETSLTGCHEPQVQRRFSSFRLGYILGELL
jgi:hypothetical protein